MKKKNLKKKTKKTGHFFRLHNSQRSQKTPRCPQSCCTTFHSPGARWVSGTFGLEQTDQGNDHPSQKRKTTGLGVNKFCVPGNETWLDKPRWLVCSTSGVQLQRTAFGHWQLLSFPIPEACRSKTAKMNGIFLLAACLNSLLELQGLNKERPNQIWRKPQKFASHSYPRRSFQCNLCSGLLTPFEGRCVSHLASSFQTKIHLKQEFCMATCFFPQAHFIPICSSLFVACNQVRWRWWLQKMLRGFPLPHNISANLSPPPKKKFRELVMRTRRLSNASLHVSLAHSCWQEKIFLKKCYIYKQEK